MKIQEATKRETLHIAAGTLAFSAVMNGVFALLGRWDLTVLWGTLLGGGFAVLNFFLLGLTVQKMAGTWDLSNSVPVWMCIYPLAQKYVSAWDN